MNQQIAIRNDGAIAVATSMVDGWAHGYMIDANGERFDWPSPLASLLGQGSWKPIGGFDLSTITPPSELSDAFEKAYKRKYSSRSEAARAAARARWGNRAVGYSQKVQTQRGEDEFEGDVKTTDVEPFDADAFIAAAAKGPVSLVGVHGGRVTSPEQWSSDPRDMGGGWLGTGTYASLIDSAGVRGQEIGYGQRQARILLDITLKKPLVLIEGKNLPNAFLRDIGPAIEREAGIRLIESPLGAGPAFDLEIRQKLSQKGYDGIVMIRNSKDEGESLGSQVVVFDAKTQTKIIDDRLSYQEWGKIMTRGVGAPLVKAQDAIARFDGDGFDLVSLEDFMAEPIAKMSRSEAGRYAANVRWGNRTPAVASIDAISLSRGQKITVGGKQLGNLTINMVDTGIDGDLRNVHIPGYALFDGANMGLRREQMPQVPARVKPQFLSEMRLQGVRASAQSVDPRTLKPSQADISAAKTGEILKKMRDGSFRDSPAGRILVSKDGFIIDGHHRWAAAVAYAFDMPGARLPIIRVDMTAADLIPAARAFGARNEVKTLGFGETLKKAARWIFGS